MKFQHLFISIFCTILLAISACGGNECDVECLNGGECQSGICNCPDGFSGVDCSVKVGPCDLALCVNADTCIVNSDGTARCICEDGWEGDRCDARYAEKYVGSFQAVDQCPSIGNSYVINVEEGPRQNAITIINFNNQTAPNVTAKVVIELVGARALLIPTQFMPFGEVNGSGSFGPGENQFNLVYSIINNGDTVNCSGLYTRR